MNQISSPLLESAVAELSKLPGIGSKTALRLALHLLRQDKETSRALGEAIIRLREEISYCRCCHNISETETCPICADHTRDRSTICIVENIKDVISVEATGQYHGLYHVLGGLISPVEGIGPSDIEIDSLLERVQQSPEVGELIFALSPTMEGDTTAFYISRRLEGSPVQLSVLSRGLSVGSDLDYTDELTLGKSILDRVPYR